MTPAGAAHTIPTTGSPAAAPALDHLVVAAHSLPEGVDWCQRTLGVVPGPGGEHGFMGTHNRLLPIASPEFPAAYLEIIAINSRANYLVNTSAKRWFDLDLVPLQRTLAQAGPQLVHWVARVPALAAAQAALTRLGLDSGVPVAAQRDTPAGLLRWRIALRPDGQRPLGGCQPTLIEWGPQHPTHTMTPPPGVGVRLRGLTLAHPQAETLQAGLQALGLNRPVTQATQPGLSATLDTPRGSLTLRMPLFSGSPALDALTPHAAHGRPHSTATPHPHRP